MSNQYWILKVRPLNKVGVPLLEVAFQIPDDLATILWQSDCHKATIKIEGKLSSTVPDLSNLVSHSEENQNVKTDFKINEG